MQQLCVQLKTTNPIYTQLTIKTKRQNNPTQEFQVYFIDFSKMHDRKKIKAFSTKIKDQLTTIHINTISKRGGKGAGFNTICNILLLENIPPPFSAQFNTSMLFAPLHLVRPKIQNPQYMLLGGGWWR